MGSQFPQGKLGNHVEKMAVMPGIKCYCLSLVMNGTEQENQDGWREGWIDGWMEVQWSYWQADMRT